MGRAWTRARSPARTAADAPAVRRCCVGLAPLRLRRVQFRFVVVGRRRRVGRPFQIQRELLGADDRRTLRSRAKDQALQRRDLGPQSRRFRRRKRAASQRGLRGPWGDLQGKSPCRRAIRKRPELPAKQGNSGDSRRSFRHPRDYPRPLRETLAPLEHLNFPSVWDQVDFGEIRGVVALRRGRPRRLGARTGLGTRAAVGV